MHPAARLVGAVLATVGALLFLIVLPAATCSGLHTNPYMGIVFFLILPGVFVFGLLLIPLGALARSPAAARGHSRRPRRGRGSI